MVDHSILERDSLILVEANSMTAVNRRSSIDEEEGGQVDHSHSTVSTPDKPASSLQDQFSGASDKLEEAPKDQIVPQSQVLKTKSSKRRGRDERAKREFKAAQEAGKSILKEEEAKSQITIAPSEEKKISKEKSSKSHNDQPDFIYADFFFSYKMFSMKKKISQAIEKLHQGLTISIKAFDEYAWRAI